MRAHAVPTLTQRERMLAAAAELTAEQGWAAVTMAKLAERVGVSRQTVYNELGGKPQLAEAMVLRELDGFLAAVQSAFEANPADLIAAIRAASRRVLELAGTNPLLHAILSTSQGADSDLLPLLTTNSELVRDAASEMIREHVAAYPMRLADARTATLVDMVVRLVLSHVMQPGGSPAKVADDVAWFAERVLRE